MSVFVNYHFKNYESMLYRSIKERFLSRLSQLSGRIKEAWSQPGIYKTYGNKFEKPNFSMFCASDKGCKQSACSKYTNIVS